MTVIDEARPNESKRLAAKTLIDACVAGADFDQMLADVQASFPHFYPDGLPADIRRAALALIEQRKG